MAETPCRGPRRPGRLVEPADDFLTFCHAVRCLPANPDAAALFLDSLDPEALAILGRAAIRRLG